MNSPLYIVDGVRTPLAKMGTDFAALDATELVRHAMAQLLARQRLDPAEIAEVIVGCVGQPVDAANLGRVAALRAGVPNSVPAITVHRNCASGFEAVTQAAEKAAAGRGDVFLVAGVESMSQVPLLYSESAAQKFAAAMRSKTMGERIAAYAKFRPSDFKPRIALLIGLTDPVCGLNMGQTAENLARDFAVSREEQDQFALRSHQRASAARDKLREEIVPIFLNGSKPRAFEHDNGVREKQTMEALAKLKPVFEKHHGTVTAGNASQITDGACALLVMTEAGVKRHGVTPLGRLVAYDYAGCDPSRMGLGPVFAINRIEQRLGLKVSDADLIEINEAFAAQVIGCQRAARSVEFCRKQLGRETPLGEIRDEILNVNGGGIALGHPMGVTGARLVLTSLLELRRRKARRALVSLCIGGGQGGALWLEAA